jgi:hypothetical protein
MSCITEILKLKGDKEFFVPLTEDGEAWISVEGGGSYKDYEYLIVLNKSGHRCGYVAIPNDHKYSRSPKENNELINGKTYASYHYENLDIDCHGGLTFMGPDHDLKFLVETKCKDIWIGFDCGHYLDLADVEAFKKYFGQKEYEDKKSFFTIINHYDKRGSGIVRAYDYVEKECKSIIDQLIKIE